MKLFDRIRDMFSKKVEGPRILNFRGYWRDCNADGIPNGPGILVTYRGEYNEISDTVKLNEILCISSTHCPNDNINPMNAYDAFQRALYKRCVECLGEGETLIYSFAKCNPAHMHDIENRLVLELDPHLQRTMKMGTLHDYRIVGCTALFDHLK